MWRQRRSFREARLSRRFVEARSEIYRRMWADAARAVSAEIDELADEYLVIRRGDRETLVWQNLVPLHSQPSMKLADDKALVHHLLRAVDVPVPDHVVVDARDLQPALEFLAASGSPCVAKPSGGTGGGAGVTGSVMTGDDLARVCLASARWSTQILLEQTIQGREYRLLFLDGELLGAVERHRPRLMGDGRSTIAELVVRENLRRVDAPAHDHLRPIRMDLDLELTLRRQGASLSTVPDAGVMTEVKTAVSENAPAENETTCDLSPALIADARRAARALHLRLAGVDLVTPNPGVGLSEAGGSVLEVNSPPGLHYHYLVAEPEHAVRVAVPVLERLLEDARPNPR